MTEETELDLGSLGIDVGAEPSQKPPQTDEPAKDTAEPEKFKRSPEAEAIDEQVKQAIRKNVDNHELACIIVDLVSPGYAIERLQGQGLAQLTPMQHLIGAVAAIGVVTVATNPDVARKLKASLTGKGGQAPNRILPERRDVVEARQTQAAPVTPPSKLPVEAAKADVAKGRDYVAEMGMRDLTQPTGAPL